MKKLLLIGALALGGCAHSMGTEVITSKEQVVILPTENMYNCPVISSYPNPKTLTDIETAQLIVQLDKYNKICKNSIESIKRYLSEAKKTVEKKS